MKGNGSNSTIKFETIFLHITIWTLYILYESSILLFINAANIYWSEILLAFLLNIALFYISSEFVLPNWGNKEKFPVAILFLLGLIGLYLYASYLETSLIFPIIQAHIPAYKKPDSIFTKLFIAQHIYRATYFIGLSFAYWFAKKLVQTERILRDTEKLRFEQLVEQKELKKEIAISNLAFYRSQINPHFIFNTLNFFYANIYPYSKNLAEAIVLLSDLMRYITEQSNREDDLVALDEEISYINNYIKLNQLRFENKLQVTFEIVGDTENKKIAPFLMMSIIENAFKYGEGSDPETPILIRIDISGHQINLKVENKINIFIRPAGTGTGLSNLRKQLDLLYPQQHTLRINQQATMFECYLNLNTATC
jgi:two-component system LytT family sensor kinase